ncbi:Lysine 6-dehydrogenase [Halomicronema hongdechloris C2206]|uniref:Lysine 6-dehydrogenase n=1 Tax=Halomicronema hongdechloris C2206 TaxID=1641165 RepID=A0A1Z3HJR5_9CYAN|nr:saccharopine dehydrogenase NADP-binding domain-containing protein [Halomicronema hongdechloris]ASC70540.1 Lysine 6-dehydrogenase [Halomicronema hongdechloris C2206]
MSQQVLILGGCGRIGGAVAKDLQQYADATITITGRRPVTPRTKMPWRVLSLDLDDHQQLRETIAQHDLVIHCAGPFSYRDDRVLLACIDQGVHYLDVADNPAYVRQALSHGQAATAAGVTAIVSTGVFPGISNVMVRQGVESLDQAETAQLSYIVAGSGGAGVTVMRTTFLELLHPIRAWIDGRWQSVAPYSQRQRLVFPVPYGPCHVYWFNTIEAMTLPESFPLRTVITKFGSQPDIYNHLTWLTARLPKIWLRRPGMVEFLAQTSYRMTEWSDRLSGIGIAMRVDIEGQRQGEPTRYTGSFTHDSTATAAGLGTGLVAQALLSGDLQQPGVWPVELAVPTTLLEQGLEQRGLAIGQSWQRLG